MKVFITGIAGLLGTHCAEYFRKKEWEVVGVDNLSEYELKRTKYNVVAAREHNINFLKSIGAEMTVFDVNNLDETFPPFERVDLIIHCAAQPAMTVAIEDPKHDAINNILATQNLLEVAKKLKIPIITCSSIHIYGNAGNENLKEGKTRFLSPVDEIGEDDAILVGDISPLHVSKRAVELYTLSYAQTYKMRAACFRLTGFYGERQFGGMDHGWVANFAIRTIMRDQITIFGTDKQVRDVLHAEDIARACHFWFKNGSSGIFNICGGINFSISLNEALSELRQHILGQQNIVKEKARFGDLYYFVGSFKKAQNDFMWKPRIDFKEGCGRLMDWVKKNKGLFK